MTAVEYVNDAIGCDSHNITCAEKMVLLQVAFTYDTLYNGKRVVPGFDSLAMFCRLSRATVVRHFARWAELGFLEYSVVDNQYGHPELRYTLPDYESHHMPEPEPTAESTAIN